MKMRALNTFQSADVGLLQGGAEFEVSDARAAEFALMGLAVEVPAPAPTLDAGAEASPPVIEVDAPAVPKAKPAAKSKG